MDAVSDTAGDGRGGGAGRTVILGIGNTLLADEGVGVHVVERLRSEGALGDDVDLIDGGTLGFALAPALVDAERLIVVDAAMTGTEAGAVSLYEGDTMDAFLGSGRQRSVHEVGLLDLLAMAQLADRLPARRALIAIRPARTDWGTTPSPAVAGAIPVACVMARDLVAKWRVQ